METMYLNIARISLFMGTIFGGRAWSPNEQFDPPTPPPPKKKKPLNFSPL